MTAVVGLLCRDGVVIGTDSSATFTAGQERTMEQPMNKLHVLRGHVIVAGTGPIGHSQRFCAIIEKAWDDKMFQEHPPLECAKLLTRAAIEDLAQTYCKLGQYGALVAYPCGDRFNLCEFQLADFQPELKTDRIWYCSMGSAQRITDPFLALMREVFWEQGPPNTQDGIFAVTWALDHAVNINPGGVNAPITIAVLERAKKGLEARLLSGDELASHWLNVQEAKGHLRDFRKKHLPEAAEGAPDIPRP